MAAEKSPAFQFYPKDFISDNHVRVMTMEARGVYITLLAFAWLDGSLPNNPAMLAQMVSMPERQFVKVWPLVRVCFQEQDGRLTQKRLESEREKQEVFRRKQSDRGALGAESRWRKHDGSMAQALNGDGASNAQAMRPRHTQAMLSDGSSSAVSDLPSAISHLQTPVVAAAAPRRMGSQRPLPGYRRLSVFPWMVDEILGMLGEQAEAFDLDKWLLLLDTSGKPLPAKLWPWLKESVSADAARVGIVAALPAAQVAGKQTTRLAAALANIKAAEAAV